MTSPILSIEQCTLLACLLEVTAPKPGNVHRGADFEDLSLLDFQLSAAAIAPVMAKAPQRPLGETILEAVEETRRWVSSNTNLGLILLIAPLAAASLDPDYESSVVEQLQTLTESDARLVYQAIRTAQPGGLGHTDEYDVASAPPADLLAAMRFAARRDLIARQYAEAFQQVFAQSACWLVDATDKGLDITTAIIHTHLRLMATFPDSLIARKCGDAIAQQAADRAHQVLQAGAPGDDAYVQASAELDFWLRSDGHRRNPGTTADMVGAGLFVALRRGDLRLPFKIHYPNET